MERRTEKRGKSGKRGMAACDNTEFMLNGVANHPCVCVCQTDSNSNAECEHVHTVN